ncbi:MAG TPA: DUF721 domain-containing protein [Drouetiella sp.]
MNNDDLHKAKETLGGRGNSASGQGNTANHGKAEGFKEDFAKELDLVRGATTRLKRGKRALDSIDNVLGKLVSSMGLDRRLKEHALLSLWPMMIGDTFASRSRPLFIDFEGNLVIATRDASVAQELSLLKPEIIKKMRFAAQSMGLKVNGVRFDLKHFHGGTPPVSDGDRFEKHKQPTRLEPSPAELAELTLSEADLEELAALKASLPNANANDPNVLKNLKLFDGESMCIKMPSTSPEPEKEAKIGRSKDVDMNHRIFAMFEQELKLRQWRRKQGFPQCPKCEQPTQLLHGAESVCSDCYFAELSHRRDI